MDADLPVVIEHRKCATCGVPVSVDSGMYSIKDRYYCLPHGREENEKRRDELHREMMQELFFGDEM